MDSFKVGDEVLVRGKVLFIYADGVLQISFERKDPITNQIAFVEPELIMPRSKNHD